MINMGWYENNRKINENNKNRLSYIKLWMKMVVMGSWEQILQGFTEKEYEN